MTLKRKLRAAWELATGQRLAELVTGVELHTIGPVGLHLPPPAIGLNLPPPPMAINLPAEPLGWLGALVAHGGACLAFEIEYITGGKYGHRYHLGPQMDGAFTGSMGQTPHLKFTPEDLLTSRYREFPCPVWPRTGPKFMAHGDEDIWGHNGGFITDWEYCLDDDLTAGAAASRIQWGYSQEANAINPYDDDWGIRVGSDGKLEVKPDIAGIDDWAKVHPGRRMKYWAKDIHDRLTDDQFRMFIGRDLDGTADEMLKDNRDDTEVVVPEYFRDTTAHLNEFYLRYTKWLYTARWLVWAGEMLRVHAGSTGPNGWTDHANAWAVTTYGHAYATGDEYYLPIGSLDFGHDYLHYDDTEPGLKVDMDSDFVHAILEALMRHTPPPGSAACDGRQIARPSETRSLCDMPDAAGSIRPPVDVLADDGSQVLAVLALYKWKDSNEYLPWFTWYKFAVDIVCSIVGSFASGAITAGVAALEQTIGAVASKLVAIVATTSLRVVSNLGRGGAPLDAGDVIGLMGSMLEASGLPETALKSLPPQLWNSLKTAGAAIPVIEGTDWESVKPDLIEIQGEIDNLKNNRKWPYIDEAFGGLGLCGKIKDEEDKL